MRRQSAFTLVELLVVIGIIALLIAMLMPALKRAHAQALAVQCTSNQRQLMMGFLLFANDHKNRLPGNFVDYQQKDPDKHAWLVDAGVDPQKAPQCGTLFKYVRNPNVYRCPATESIKYNIQVGSNGCFDYVSYGVFTGALTTKIPGLTRFQGSGTKISMIPTPIICEEELKNGGINDGNIEGLHNCTDRLASTHRGGGHYATLDGSVRWFIEPAGTSAMNYFTKGPSGKEVCLGTGGYGILWGWWNAQ